VKKSKKNKKILSLIIDNRGYQFSLCFLNTSCLHIELTSARASLTSSCAMEVVLCAAIVSQGILAMVDVSDRRRALSAMDNTPRSIPQTHVVAPQEPSPNAPAHPSQTSSANIVIQSTEVDVNALKAKLKELNAMARTLTSPDSFVQYARVTREANAVEAELASLNGLLPPSTPSTTCPSFPSFTNAACLTCFHRSLYSVAQLSTLRPPATIWSGSLNSISFLTLWGHEPSIIHFSLAWQHF
jgi:hypothetical protein